MASAAVSAILEGLKYVPQIVQVGKDIWKKVRPPSGLGESEAQNGIVGNNFYSGDYKFQISIPDDNWRFWKPTPQFIASLGTLYTMPVRDVPIIIMSKNMVKLTRPMVTVVVEDVGALTSVQELVDLNRFMLNSQGFTVDPSSIKLSPTTNSAALIAVAPNPLKEDSNLYSVMQIFLYAARAYYINAIYAPPDEQSPQLFGGLQDIMNSFKLIK